MTETPRDEKRMELLCIGFGYSAAALARSLPHDAWNISGTTRKADKHDDIRAQNVTPIPFDGETGTEELRAAIAIADQLLVSASPTEAGDPVLNALAEEITNAPRLAWIGYLSTIGVYGDHDGEWIDETAPLRPVSQRGLWRVKAERDWFQLGQRAAKPVMAFRLGGIYGPGRSPLDKLRAGMSRRIIKPGQVFNRIHATDIAATLRASIERPNPDAVYNVVDDEPAPPQDVIEFAARLLDMPPPPPEPFETAEMSPMARAFYSDNRRVENLRIKQELGVELTYPSYREGLKSLMEQSA